jgi:hypothetical protein
MGVPLAAAGGAALLGAIPSIIQVIQSKKMMNQADELESQYQRPDYQIAPSVTGMVDYAKGMTRMGDMPGGQMLRNQMGEATAAGITAMKEMGTGAEAYGGISQLVRGQQEGLRGQQMDLASLVQQNQGQYLDTLGVQAGEERAKWEWEEADPYIMAAGKAAELRKSGIEGRMDAFSDMAGVGSGFLGGMDEIDWGSIFGGKNKGGGGEFLA